ncbi:MAG: WG repeat-containing protein [Lachnospiraceae bacterium]|nr:WG repeat-containing protein [Lachnospiraceae bacterium]
MEAKEKNKKKSPYLIGGVIGVIIVLAVVLCLMMCGKKDTWQNQYDLGVRLYGEGDYEAAILAFQAAIDIDPKNAEAYLGLAEVYLALGDPQAAADTLVLGAGAVEDEAQKAEIRKMLDEISEEYGLDIDPDSEDQGDDSQSTEQESQGSLTGSTDGNDPDSDAVITAMEESIAFLYDFAAPFSEGFARVGLEVDGDMKYFFIDTEGNVISNQYDYAEDFHEGRALVALRQQDTVDDGNGGTWTQTVRMYGYIDAAGNEVIPLQYRGAGDFTDVCTSFYNGRAEVVWVTDLNTNDTYSNVIDLDGNKLLPVDHKVTDIVGYGWVPPGDPRMLGMTVQYSSGTFCEWNPAQRAWYLSSVDFPVVIYDGTQSHWIDENLEIIMSIDGFAVDFGTGYVMLVDPHHQSIMNESKFIDREGNIVADNFWSMTNGVNGQMIATVSTMTDFEGVSVATGFYQAILSPEGQVLAEGFSYAEPCGSGYVVSYDEYVVGEGRTYTYLDENLAEVFSYECEWLDGAAFDGDEVTLFRVETYDTAANTYRNQYIKPNGDVVFDSSDEYTVTLLTNNYAVLNWADRSALYSTDGQELMVVPGMTEVQWGYSDLDEFDFVICGNDPSGESVYRGVTAVNGNLELTELVYDMGIDLMYVPDKVYALRESEQAVLKGTGDYYAPLTLSTGDKVLYEGAAASLIANNLYKTAEVVAWDDMSYGFSVSGMTLHTVDGSWTSETYDEIGLLSENFISVCRDGKWGYLNVK